MGRNGSCSITALVPHPFWRGTLSSWFHLWHFVQLLLFIMVKIMAQSRSTINYLTTGEICWWLPLLSCSSPGLEPSPHSWRFPLRGAGVEVGQEGWRSRDCKLWHSLDSLFLTLFLYLMFKMVRRRGCQDGPVSSLCTQALPPALNQLLTWCRHCTVQRKLRWASVWFVLMRCTIFFSKNIAIPKSTG